MANGTPLPEPLNSELKVILDKEKVALDNYNQKSVDWNNGISMNIALSGTSKHFSKVTRYLINSSFSNGSNDISSAINQVIAKNPIMIANATSSLTSLGVGNAGQNAFLSNIQVNGTIQQVLKITPDNLKAGLINVFKQMGVEYRTNLEVAMDRESAKLHSETFNWPVSSQLIADSEPYSVQLFVFEE